MSFQHLSPPMQCFLVCYSADAGDDDEELIEDPNYDDDAIRTQLAFNNNAPDPKNFGAIVSKTGNTYKPPAYKPPAYRK